MVPGTEDLILTYHPCIYRKPFAGAKPVGRGRPEPGVRLLPHGCGGWVGPWTRHTAVSGGLELVPFPEPAAEGGPLPRQHLGVHAGLGGVFARPRGLHHRVRLEPGLHHLIAPVPGRRANGVGWCRCLAGRFLAANPGVEVVSARADFRRGARSQLACIPRLQAKRVLGGILFGAALLCDGVGARAGGLPASEGRVHVRTGP
mmetsp:Transcript_13731/g.20219  ORF Transcript_13731/g.20219 Transcript_13731/m.20219 type:complete len:202 (-) Transcript_13731:1379-1984(-)